MDKRSTVIDFTRTTVKAPRILAIGTLSAETKAAIQIAMQLNKLMVEALLQGEMGVSSALPEDRQRELAGAILDLIVAFNGDTSDIAGAP